MVQLILSPATAVFWKHDTLDSVSSKLMAVTVTLILVPISSAFEFKSGRKKVEMLIWVSIDGVV